MTDFGKHACESARYAVESVCTVLGDKYARHASWAVLSSVGTLENFRQRMPGTTAKQWWKLVTSVTRKNMNEENILSVNGAAKETKRQWFAGVVAVNQNGMWFWDGFYVTPPLRGESRSEWLRRMDNVHAEAVAKAVATRKNFRSHSRAKGMKTFC